VAAGNGVIDPVGSAPADGAEDDAGEDEDDDGVAYGVPFVEHPATPPARAHAATTATARSRVANERRDRSDRTGLPTLNRSRTQPTY
jgi:hypothetical protein